MFIRELHDLTTIDTSSIENSLHKLYDRGFVDRKKDVDVASKRNNKEFFKYNITSKGVILFESTETDSLKKLSPK